MDGQGLLVTLIIGALAGWIASMTMNRSHGLIVNLLVGLIGAVVGTYLAGFFHIHVVAGFIGALVVATVGAIVLLFILGLFRRRA